MSQSDMRMPDDYTDMNETESGLSGSGNDKEYALLAAGSLCTTVGIIKIGSNASLLRSNSMALASAQNRHRIAQGAGFVSAQNKIQCKEEVDRLQGCVNENKGGIGISSFLCAVGILSAGLGIWAAAQND